MKQTLYYLADYSPAITCAIFALLWTLGVQSDRAVEIGVFMLGLSLGAHAWIHQSRKRKCGGNG